MIEKFTGRLPEFLHLLFPTKKSYTLRTVSVNKKVSIQNITKYVDYWPRCSYTQTMVLNRTCLSIHFIDLIIIYQLKYTRHMS